ncbi:GTP cyclohydrolase II-domain-containing protein [Pavlovales sp. CCMP2436]|nr:GTP cyclohydrolase II-domain-containing protein [Pavlovales sp. CCMP2436]
MLLMRALWHPALALTSSTVVTVATPSCRLAFARPLLRASSAVATVAAPARRQSQSQSPSLAPTGIATHNERVQVAPVHSVRLHVSTPIPTEHGLFEVAAFTYTGDATVKEHLALSHGDVRALAAAGPVLVRVHSECLTGEVIKSRLCDCGEQLDHAMARVAAEGGGVVIYLRQEGRGIGLIDKLKAYNLQRQGHDTVDANRMLGRADDERDYGVAARILEALGVRSIRLLTNNPLKIEQLTLHGIHVAERVPHEPEDVSEHNATYLLTKAARMGHMLGGANAEGDELMKKKRWADRPVQPHFSNTSCTAVPRVGSQLPRPS